jgi:hypothetical protein
MGTIELRKMWVTINDLLTSINLVVVSILGVLIPKRHRPSTFPLIANIVLLAVIVLIFALLIGGN